jgi:SAM-dependent methyltransferase
MQDPTTIFSNRVENYVKHPLGYPRALPELLRTACQWDETSVIADVGSGTGLFSRPFLDAGNTVFGVEPNDEMRAAAEHLLAGYPRFISVDGRAEATTLSDHSVDFVTAGGAFHWFEREPTRKEFARILKPGGWVVLAWNVARTEGTPFLVAYHQFWETFLWRRSAKEESPDIVTPFFGEGRFTEVMLDNTENNQALDLDALKGGILSSSLAPQPGEPRHRQVFAELESIFQQHQRGGTVTIEYDTRVLYGQLSPA